MNNYRYILDKSSKKYTCPSCGKKRFVKYVDLETGNYLDENYGRCDREAACSYWLNPYNNNQNKDSFNKIKNLNNFSLTNVSNLPTSIKTEFIPPQILEDTMNEEGYHYNKFLNNLCDNIDFPFPVVDVSKVILLYNLGTITEGYMKNAITFPFIDAKNRIRAIQVKKFNESNHTIGKPDFIHSILDKQYEISGLKKPQWLIRYLMNDKKVSCLFGEHLLSKYETNPIALVEAPKSAIYGTLYFGFPDNPDNMLWLAVYSLRSLTHEKCKSLKGRDVYLFPDLSKGGTAFKLWKKRAKELEQSIPGLRITISPLLEDSADEKEREQGLDIADYLIKLDWRKFRKLDQIKPGTESEVSNSSVRSEFSANQNKTLFSSSDIDDQEQSLSFISEEEDKWSLEEREVVNDYFRNFKLPQDPILLNNFTTIKDIQKFVESHLKAINSNTDLKVYNQCLHRAQELMSIIKTLEDTIAGYQCNSP